MSLTFGFITMGNLTTISSRTLGVRATTCMKYPIWIKSHLKIQQNILSNNTIWADCHTNFDSIQKTTRVKKLIYGWSKLNLIQIPLPPKTPVYKNSWFWSIQKFYSHGIFSILNILTKENLSMAKHLQLWVPDHIPGIRVVNSGSSGF